MKLPCSELFNLKNWHNCQDVHTNLKSIQQLLDNEFNEGVKDYKNQNVVIMGSVHLGENVQLNPYVVIDGPVWIGDGCKLGPNCYIRPYTVLESNINIGFGVEIKESLIGDGSTIAHLSYIGNSIIGRNVMLGANFCTAVERLDCNTISLNLSSKMIPTELLKLGTIIGDNTRIGVGTSVMPGIAVGSDCIIGPHMVIWHHINDGCKVFLKLHKIPFNYLEFDNI